MTHPVFEVSIAFHQPIVMFLLTAGRIISQENFEIHLHQNAFEHMQKSVNEKISQSHYKADKGCQNEIKQNEQYPPTNK